MSKSQRNAVVLARNVVVGKIFSRPIVTLCRTIYHNSPLDNIVVIRFRFFGLLPGDRVTSKILYERRTTHVKINISNNIIRRGERVRWRQSPSLFTARCVLRVGDPALGRSAGWLLPIIGEEFLPPPCARSRGRNGRGSGGGFRIDTCCSTGVRTYTPRVCKLRRRACRPGTG